MNRTALIAAVAERTGLDARTAAASLDALLDTIASAVADGDAVTIAGFGTFEPRHRAARAGRNPQTGEAIEIAASVSPAFKPAAAFNRQVSTH
ncbi:HU family DNA-binding protein [Nocardioides sp.]|uniref:HU family DNA-binding protein n=1 Tax=Nocardioides sp. TaxID=35761 RepID=UPI0035146180